MVKLAKTTPNAALRGEIRSSEVAREMATTYREGQFRNSGAPGISHETGVVGHLERYGYHDEETISIGWLHDCLEDTKLTIDKIRDVFGATVANGVHLLTRNVDREAYKKRLLGAPENVQMVKLCDLLDNVLTIKYLSPEGQKRKIDDSLGFYIPLAKKICPPLADELATTISSYTEPKAF